MSPETAVSVINEALRLSRVEEKISLTQDWKTMIRLTNQASRYSDLLTQQDKFEQASEIETAIGVILEFSQARLAASKPSPVVRFTPPSRGVDLGSLPSTRKEEEKEAPAKKKVGVAAPSSKVETFDEAALIREVSVVNAIPGLKKKLNLRMEREEADPILNLAADRVGELSDSSDSGSEEECDHLMGATTLLNNFFIAKSKGVAKLIPAKRTVLVY